MIYFRWIYWDLLEYCFFLFRSSLSHCNRKSSRVFTASLEFNVIVRTQTKVPRFISLQWLYEAMAWTYDDVFFISSWAKVLPPQKPWFLSFWCHSSFSTESEKKMEERQWKRNSLSDFYLFMFAKCVEWNSIDFGLNLQVCFSCLVEIFCTRKRIDLLAFMAFLGYQMA